MTRPKIAPRRGSVPPVLRCIDRRCPIVVQVGAEEQPFACIQLAQDAVVVDLKPEPKMHPSIPVAVYVNRNEAAPARRQQVLKGTAPQAAGSVRDTSATAIHCSPNAKQGPKYRKKKAATADKVGAPISCKHAFGLLARPPHRQLPLFSTFHHITSGKAIHTIVKLLT